MTQWTVVIDWADGDVEDSDEIAVLAKTAAAAVLKVLPSWIERTSSKWPDCALKEISVFAPKRLRRLA